MIEGGLTSAGGGRVGEPMDGEPGPEISVETTLGGFELAGGELVAGATAGGWVVFALQASRPAIEILASVESALVERALVEEAGPETPLDR